MYREILTKAIIAKGQKTIIEEKTINTNQKISKVLGCWIINHKFDLIRKNQQIYVKGTYDVYFWFGYDNDSKCGLVNETYSFEDEIPYSYTLEKILLSDNSLIKSLENITPKCGKMEYDDSSIIIEVHRTYNIDIIGETKIKIKVDDILIDQQIDTQYVKSKKEN